MERTTWAELKKELLDPADNLNAMAALMMARNVDAGRDAVNAAREMRIQMAAAKARAGAVRGGVLTALRGGADTSRQAPKGYGSRSA